MTAVENDVVNLFTQCTEEPRKGETGIHLEYKQVRERWIIIQKREVWLVLYRQESSSTRHTLKVYCTQQPRLSPPPRDDKEKSDD